MLVSPDDANQYVMWLSRKTGKTYRLLLKSELELVDPRAKSVQDIAKELSGENYWSHQNRRTFRVARTLAR